MRAEGWSFTVVSRPRRWERHPAAAPAGPPTDLRTAPRPLLLCDPGVPQAVLPGRGGAGAHRDTNHGAGSVELHHGDEAPVHGPTLGDGVLPVTAGGPSGTYLVSGDWERGDRSVVAQRRYERTTSITTTCRPGDSTRDSAERTLSIIRHAPR